MLIQNVKIVKIARKCPEQIKRNDIWEENGRQQKQLDEGLFNDCW